MAGPYDKPTRTEDANEGGPVYIDPRSKKHSQRQNSKRGASPSAKPSRKSARKPYR